jgi:uncharacterized damage-inducible protein DinB
MKRPIPNLTGPIVKEARRVLIEVYPPRIARCLKMLSEDEIWWRPNHASNSVGNLILHLQGNVRQWIISGLGGQPDIRERDREFDETGPVPRRGLLAGFRKTIKEADEVLGRLKTADLMRMHSIQGFDVTGLQAVCHVADHFAFHAGQIVFVAKLKLGKDLKFTRLPKQRKATGKS